MPPFTMAGGGQPQKQQTTMGGNRRRSPSSAVEIIGTILNTIFHNKHILLLMNASLIVFLVVMNGQSSYILLPDAPADTFSSSSSSAIRKASTVMDLPKPAIASEPCPDPPPPPPPKIIHTNGMSGSTTEIKEYNDAEIGKTASVLAMATGYSLLDYQRFVGSLRKTGFEGNIILAVSPNINSECENYLATKNVILHKVQYVECSHPVKKNVDKNDEHEKELVTCVHPYPKLKHRWARFPLLRDLLMQCGGHEHPEVQCGGPVLITDMRDTMFQRNPFGPEAPKVYGLQVFAEHYSIRTTHWLVDWPVGDCKGVHYDEPMLCSGTTIGTRQAMLDYLEIFHKEMNLWMESPKCCCFDTNGDDQSMHNFLFYSGALNSVDGGVQAVKNRNGLVNTVGAMGSLIFESHARIKREFLGALKDPDRPVKDAHHEPLDMSPEDKVDEEGNSKTWMGAQYGLVDMDGYFVDYDGSRSFIIHQYDRFGRHFDNWIDGNRERYYYP